jgi:hypothetical protein
MAKENQAVASKAPQVASLSHSGSPNVLCAYNQRTNHRARWAKSMASSPHVSQ